MLSVVVLTKNEEKNIIDALESVYFANEIIIIDDYSTDMTLDVINSQKNLKVKIYKRKLDDFSSQRNYALEKATCKWVLFLDADERVSPGLRGEIEQLLNKDTNSNGFFIKRHDIMWKKELKHGEVGNQRLLRLAKKNSGKWKGKVHEEWLVLNNTSELEYPLYHYPHQTISEFISEINHYTTLRAKELFESNKTVSLLEIVSYPPGKFIHNYVLRKGYKDRTPGFIVAMLMSFHSFLVRAKLWQLLQGK